MKISEILSRLQGVHKSGHGWMACCPAHSDRVPSLSMGEGQNGCILLKCHAGCSQENIIAALGLKFSDLFEPQVATAKPRLVKTYDYCNAARELVFQVCRYEPKGFRQRRPDPDNPGAWLWNMQGVTRELYRLPEVLRQVRNEGDVFLVEGEKDADALVALGLCATCNPGGAGKWQGNYTAILTGAYVWIIPDRDEPGRKHAALVVRELTGKAASVQVVELPDRGAVPIKDAADWIAAGGTADELADLLGHAPSWVPPSGEKPQPSIPDDGPSTATDSVELKATLFEISQKKKLTTSERNTEMARAVITALQQRGRFFFHADFCDHATAMFFDTRRKLLLQIASDAFQSWLADFIGINRIERTYVFIFNAIEDETLNGQTTRLTPEAYWAARAGAIYLSNGDGQIIKITPGQIAQVDNGTDDVLFAVGRTLRPWSLTAAVDPFAGCRVFAGMRATAGHGRDLLRLWATALPSSQRCKPPLALAGTVGSGKTRTALGIAELYGLPPRVLVPNENGENDLWTSLDAGGLVIIDNADTKVRWLPDALAAASTDGSHEKRRLYSDGQIVRQRARAWICITSANPTFGADAGLADRLLVERLERREGDNAESELSDEIAAHRDAGLSWIAQMLSKALADTAPVPANLNKRHPDFAAFAVRLGRAMGCETEAVAALQSAEADKSLFNLENDDLGAALLLLIEREGLFAGTAAELAGELPDLDGNYWTSKRIGKRLAKLWPHVTGVFNATAERSHGGILTYSIRARGGFGGFQDPILPKVPMRENDNTF
jgi:hypothetical protein